MRAHRSMLDCSPTTSACLLRPTCRAGLGLRSKLPTVAVRCTPPVPCLQVTPSAFTGAGPLPAQLLYNCRCQSQHTTHMPWRPCLQRRCLGSHHQRPHPPHRRRCSRSRRHFPWPQASSLQKASWHTTSHTVPAIDVLSCQQSASAKASGGRQPLACVGTPALSPGPKHWQNIAALERVELQVSQHTPPVQAAPSRRSMAAHLGTWRVSSPLGSSWTRTG